MTSLRTLFKVAIMIETPWRIGTGAGVTGDELNYLVDPRTAQLPDQAPTAYVPATALLGSLRRHLVALDPERCRQWLGIDIEEANIPKSMHGTPTGPDGQSVEKRRTEPGRDTLLTALGPGMPVAESDMSKAVPHGVRRSTAVNPDTRAAANTTLRSVRVVAATKARPTVLTWFLEVPGDASDFGAALKTWRPFVGAGRSVGWGRGRVTRIERVNIDLATEKDLTWWLTARPMWFDGQDDARAEPVFEESTESTESTERAAPVIEVTITVQDALHVGTGEPVTGEKAVPAPQDITRDGDGYAIVPGSSVKGLFRSRIARMVALANLDEQIIPNLFGEDRSTEDSEASRGRGVLRFDDVTFRPEPEDAPKKTKTIDRHHVAIDRFTGGARDGALYAVRAIARDERAKLRIFADLKLTPVESALLWWVLKDLHDGMTGIGGMTGRGYGTVTIDPEPNPCPLGTDESGQVVGADEMMEALP